MSELKENDIRRRLAMIMHGSQNHRLDDDALDVVMESAHTIKHLDAELCRLRTELEECTRAWALTTSQLAQERERVRELGIVTESGVVWNKNGNPHQQPVGTVIAALSAGEGAKQEEPTND